MPAPTIPLTIRVEHRVSSCSRFPERAIRIGRVRLGATGAGMRLGRSSIGVAPVGLNQVGRSRNHDSDDGPRRGRIGQRHH